MVRPRTSAKRPWISPARRRRRDGAASNVSMNTRLARSSLSLEPARRTALPASSNPTDRMLEAPGRRTCSGSVDGCVPRLGHSIVDHEVDESALHVRRHQLDADLLAHLEPTRFLSWPEVVKGAADPT